MRKAHRWGCIASIPYFDLEKEPKKLPNYVSPEHFAMIYSGCGSASVPGDLPYPAADWWRGLVVTAYMTGWRVSELLALRREDVDLDAGTAITRWEDNKGKRDERVKLHPVVSNTCGVFPASILPFFPGITTGEPSKLYSPKFKRWESSSLAGGIMSTRVFVMFTVSTIFGGHLQR